MTAEVAVLNKSAVALAADSAMTTYVRGIGKIYPAQKLFPLARNRPVGVMIFHSSELVGIPWETIVKMYYHESGPANRSQETVTAYLHDLMAFASGPAFGDAEERESRSIAQIAREALDRVKEAMEDADLDHAISTEMARAKSVRPRRPYRI